MKPETVVKMIAEREWKLPDINARLTAATVVPDAIELETRRLEREARKHVEDLRGFLRGDPEAARRALESIPDGH